MHVSAIGADPNSASHYAASKGAGEALVRQAFPGATILRPSLVFGPEDQLFNRFAGMARLLPFMPVMGPGWADIVWICSVLRSLIAIFYAFSIFTKKPLNSGVNAFGSITVGVS